MTTENFRAVFSCGAVYCVVQCSSNVCLGINSLSMTIQMKVTYQYFPVVLFITMYKVFLTFESVDEILKCDHSNESY